MIARASATGGASTTGASATRTRASAPAAAALVALTSGCTPDPVALARFDDVGFIAALRLDPSGQVVAASEVRALAPGQALDLFTAHDAPTVIVGWASGAFGGVTPDPTTPLVVRAACAPRLPTPLRAARLDDSGAAALTLPVDPTTLPVLSASWAEELCPAVAPERFAYRVGCANARVAPDLTTTAACTFQLGLDPISTPLAARVDPDGTVCVAPAAPSGPSCTALPARPPAVAAFACGALDACPVEVFAATDTTPLALTRAALLDVPPFVPDRSLTGASPQLPPRGEYVGYTHDLVVLGDRVVVSTSTGAARILCSGGEVPGLLHALRTDDLSLVATATAPSCLSLLAADGDAALGLYVDGPRFGLVRIGADLRVTRAGPLDDRGLDALAPPTARPECERPIDLLVAAERVYVVSERLPHCAAPGTSIHVLDRSTLAVRSRHDLAVLTPWRALLDGDRLHLASATERVVSTHQIPGLEVIETRRVPPDLTRNDTVIADLARDGDDLLVTTTRNQPALRRSTGGADFAERGFAVDAELDPVAVVPRWSTDRGVVARSSADRGLVVGVRDGDAQRWPAVVALYDPVTLTILPGVVDLGHGPPRRLRPDGHGGVIALLPWQAAVVRIRPL